MPTIEELAVQVAGLHRRVEAAEAVLEIQALKARYGELVDGRFSRGELVDAGTLRQVTEAAADLFTEDGVWDGGPHLGRHVGRPAIASRLARPTLTFSRHLFVSPASRWTGTVPRPVGPAQPLPSGGWSSWRMCGYEDDEYARVDGVWLHRSMRLTTLVMARVDEGWAKILA